uniref:NET domain-containing protein n=1 Tax=Nucleocytoviricota sp. TaxID=2809609 RepID=A0A9E8G4H4_9VIRU|nr:hypothetical protein [Nucleocytoviricota sp.]
MEIDNNTIQNDYIEKNSIVNVENINSFSTETLNLIKQTIENMDKVHHIEILKLLENQYDVNLNENNNGTFINLTDLKNETIQKLQEYINYFKKTTKPTNQFRRSKKTNRKLLF